MKPDYKNWVPKSMLYILAILAIALYIATISVNFLMNDGDVKTILSYVFLIAAIVLTAICLWMTRMYCAFSYNGKRKLSKDIIDGIAGYVKVPDNGLALDVGCGSGALTIAVAKNNPKAKV